jgi:hypothetical protein
VNAHAFSAWPINRYGTTLGGMFTEVYDCSVYAALRDLVDNDDDFAEFRDLMPYDMLRMPQNTWTLSAGDMNFALARQLTKRLLVSLHDLEGKPLEAILPSVSAETFQTVPLDRYGATAGSAFENVYGSSPYAALKDLIDSDPELAAFRNFMPYDMRTAPKETWTLPNGEKNVVLARCATKQLIRALQLDSWRTLSTLLPVISKEDFTAFPINKYGTTLTGLLGIVYRGTLHAAIHDLAMHDNEFAAFRDLMPYDMLRTPQNTWTLPTGEKNFALARQATRELVESLQRFSGLTLEKIFSSINSETFLSHPFNKYGTTLGGMFASLYECSTFAAIQDLVMHDDAFSEYRDIMPYDMGMAPQNTWNLPDGNKNVALARNATKRLLARLRATQGGSLEEILPSVCGEMFQSVPVDRYGATLRGMLSAVYDASPYAALKDLIDSDPELAEFRDFKPYDMSQAPQYTWTLRDGSRNYALAREATRQLIAAVQHSRSLLGEAASTVKYEDFSSTSINRYGTTLGGMLQMVYDGSSRAAIADALEGTP